MKRKREVRRRLLDALIEDVILTPLPNRDVVLDPADVAGHNLAIQPFLESAQCIEASNIARFFEQSYTTTPDTFAAFTRDLKCIAPPFRSFFVEWEKPFGIHIGLRMGVLFLACPPELAADTARAIMGVNAHATPRQIQKYRDEFNPKWIYLTFDFVEFPNKDSKNVSGLRGPFHVGVTAVAEDGALHDFWLSNGTDAISERESMQLALASLVAWTALAMMNCHNIDTVEHVAPEPFQRSRERKGKRPLVSYRTIQVNVDKTPGNIAAPSLLGDGTDARLHGKRGHMKDYRKGNGLFGKYKGLWYWGPTLAGSADAGVVVADYQLKKETP